MTTAGPTVPRQTLPPAPQEPTEQQRQRFQSDAYGYLDDLAGRLGSMFTLRLGALGNEGLTRHQNNGSWVFLCRPDQVREMYSADTENVSGAAANAIFFGTDEASLAYLEGAAHRRRRKQVQPLFSAARDYVPLIAERTRAHLAGWPRGGAAELFPRLQELTVDIITEVVCGDYAAGSQTLIRELLPRTENGRLTRAELLDADRRIRAVIERELADQTAADQAAADQGQGPGPGPGSGETVSQVLRRLAAEGDQSLTPAVVRDEIFSLLYTGFSTTANTLAWALARIATDDLARQRLRAELTGAGLGGAAPTEPLTHRAINGLPWLDAIVSETLRLHPVTPLNGVRLVTRPLTVGGYLIPPGTVLVHCAHVLQREDSVFADAWTFRPERFLDQAPQAYSWGAFGGGSRTCVGKSYSRTEMRTILAVLVASVDLELANGLVAAQQQGFFMAPQDWLLGTVSDVPDVPGSPGSTDVPASTGSADEPRQHR
jgi:cytochrome P450